MQINIIGRKIGASALVAMLSLSVAGCSANNINSSYSTDLADEYSITSSVEKESATEKIEPTTIKATTPPTTVASKSEEGKIEVGIDISCEKNLAFSKYDVNVYVDSSLLGKVDHGKEKSFSAKLTNGKHTLRCEKDGDSSVDGEISFEVSKAQTYKYRISCTKSQVEIEEMVQQDDEKSKEQKEEEQPKSTKSTEKSKVQDDGVSQEYKNALKTAQNYVDIMAISKQGLYDQLTSEYGEKFPSDAAQYAIDNVKADWKKEALESAESYYLNMNMSKSEVYDQLVSEYGEKFTPEEAQYAIDNLKD